MDLEKLLNEKQKEACEYLGGHLRIIAGAGSGKTRVLTYRIAYLIDNVGIDPKSILAITFTNKAANEMRERVERILGSEHTGVTLCTIHSLCVRILRQHIRVLNYPSSFVIMDEEDQKSLLKKLYKEKNINQKEISYNSCLSMISSWKCSNITPEFALMNADMQIEKSKAIIYDAYVNYQKEHYLLDFDDLIIFTVKILDTHEDIREYWQNRYQFLHVDEFQDVDNQSYQLIKLLTGKNSMVCVVGDPDQTIYTFRGASIRYIMDFEKSFKGAKTIYLNQNYRSTKNILNATNALIHHNQDRLEKELFTDNNDGDKIIHFCADSDKAEAEYVLDQIDEIISNTDGVNYRDFAILYRANYLSRQIEQELITNHIPYRIFGGLKFFNRKEIKDILSYLRLIAIGDDLAFERVINVPTRGIGDKTIDKIRNYASGYGLSMMDACSFHLREIGLSTRINNKILEFVELIETLRNSKLPLLENYEHLLSLSGYEQMLKQDQEEARIQNLMELKNSIASFLERNNEGTLQDYLQEVALYTNTEVADDSQYVSLMTIHMSKGLEFPYIFVIGLSENIFPSIRSLEDSDDGVEEERRLAYVAYTRAMKQLYLVESEGYSYVSNGQKVRSRFISEIDEKYISHKGKTTRYQDENYILNNARLHINEKIHYDEVIDVDWMIGDLVTHDIFGKGVIIKVQKGIVQIAFPMPHGIKSLLANHPSLKKNKPS